MSGFRPVGALSLDDLSVQEAENKVYEMEFTIMFHIFFAIASSCLAWVFMLKPMMSRKKLVSVIFNVIWLVILPIIFLVSGVMLDSIMSRESTIFIYLKFISVWVTALALFGFVFYYNMYGDSKMMHKIRTVLFGGLLFVNIMEAAFDQIINRREETADEIIDIVNGSFGIFLGILVIASLYYSKGVGVVKTKDMTFLDFPLDTFFILAYTFWNILFRSYLLENSSTLLFAMVSLFLPLLLHFMGIGNWLQNRVFTLFFYIIIMLGFTKLQGRIAPFYNEQGYIEEADSSSPLSYIQGEEWYKILMLVLTAVCIGGSVYTIFKKRK